MQSIKVKRKKSHKIKMNRKFKLKKKKSLVYIPMNLHEKYDQFSLKTIFYNER